MAIFFSSLPSSNFCPSIVQAVTPEPQPGPSAPVTAEAKNNGTQQSNVRRVNSTEPFTISSRLRTRESTKPQSNSNQEKWALKVNSPKAREKMCSSNSSDLRLSSMENQLNSSSFEKLSSVLDIGKRRFVDYDPVNMLEDFNTRSFEDNIVEKCDK